ncbi:hypothetical protein CP532_1766 [Ophiocordyceps camponoti-leonardi (nom. inval.)]|nr:hypothetical protein CP532_1766 [Ophiocordyceps camponoti-leonardi (nom. inval.)]
MAPRPKNRPSFCEWVIGSRIEDIDPVQPKPEPPPPQKRDVVRVEVMTDDEAEEDTLTVTYPRSQRVKPTANARKDAVVKKVRFHPTPTKSAIKKDVAASSEAEEDTSESETKSEQESSDAESSDASSEKKATRRRRRRRRRRRSKKRGSSKPNPKPPCQCPACVRNRESLKCQAGESDEAKSESEDATSESEEATTDSEASSTEAVAVKPQPPKCNKKKEKKANEADADDEASSSAAPDEAAKPAKKKSRRRRRKARNQQHRAREEASQPSSAEGGDKTAAAEGDAQNVKDAEFKRKQRKGWTKRHHYPAASMGHPHPFRPQLIEPIRAEVVHTEKVMETADDPPPNAFYDPKHGVLRVYHGAKYGNHSGHALYPRHEERSLSPPCLSPPSRSPPMGTRHHPQNPYLYGFNRPRQGPAPDAMPITQGMPVPPLQAMCAPPGLTGGPGGGGHVPGGVHVPGGGGGHVPGGGHVFAPGVGYAPGGYGPGNYAPGGYAPGNYAPGGYAPGAYSYAPAGAYPYGGFVPTAWRPQGTGTGAGNGFKGAFSMSGANGASPLSRHMSNGADNNVAPEGVPADNPYYPGSRGRSQNGAAGSRTTCNVSQANGTTSPVANGEWPIDDGMANTGPPACAQPSWGDGAGNQTTGLDGNGNGQAQQQPPWFNGMDPSQMCQGTNEGGAAAAGGEGGGGWNQPAEGQEAAGAGIGWGDNCASTTMMPGSFPPPKTDVTSPPVETEW